MELGASGARSLGVVLLCLWTEVVYRAVKEGALSTFLTWEWLCTLKGRAYGPFVHLHFTKNRPRPAWGKPSLGHWCAPWHPHLGVPTSC